MAGSATPGSAAAKLEVGVVLATSSTTCSVVSASSRRDFPLVEVSRANGEVGDSRLDTQDEMGTREAASAPAHPGDATRAPAPTSARSMSSAAPTVLPDRASFVRPSFRLAWHPSAM